ncbi:hypothetical protein [Streptomyces virginiae]|uniref:hypothetical protein n=1 Tax=Streptomyces virginiae TaxID=1961 RepID=UPI00367C2946
MARSFFHSPVSDREYVQRVRRHPPSSLLPLIAQVSSTLPTKIEWQQERTGRYRPWALADAAWVSLSRGNEDRQRAATPDDLGEILAQYIALDDPIRHLPVGERLEGFLLRVAGQQFTWQEDDFSELTRSLAVLVQTQPTKPLKVLTGNWERDLLGCTLSDYVGLGQLLYGAATHTGGRFNPEWLPDDELGRFEDLTSRVAVAAAIERHFSTGVEEERARFADGLFTSDPMLRRYTPNPLRARPLVRGFGRDYLIPVTSAVLGKVSPMGLYYTGMERYGEAFSQDLGELFEQYIGRHLRLIPGADVHPEIVYGKKNGERGVDWIVVLPGLVVLVEVKSARPTAGLRLGPQQFAGKLTEKLEKAFGQINKSAGLINERHEAFTHIPNDRPTLGVVVTMEPFHLFNAPEFRSVLPATTVPTVVASASELEDAVVLTENSLEQALLAHIKQPPPGGWSLRDLSQGRTAINPILDEAWAAYPWGAEHLPGTDETSTSAP